MMSAVPVIRPIAMDLSVGVFSLARSVIVLGLACELALVAMPISVLVEFLIPLARGGHRRSCRALARAAPCQGKVDWLGTGSPSSVFDQQRAELLSVLRFLLVGSVFVAAPTSATVLERPTRTRMTVMSPPAVAFWVERRSSSCCLPARWRW